MLWICPYKICKKIFHHEEISKIINKKSDLVRLIFFKKLSILVKNSFKIKV